MCLGTERPEGGHGFKCAKCRGAHAPEYVACDGLRSTEMTQKKKSETECGLCQQWKPPEDGECDHKNTALVFYKGEKRRQKDLIAWCERCGSILFREEPHCEECRTSSNGHWQKPGRCSLHRHDRPLVSVPETPEQKAMRLLPREDESLTEWFSRVQEAFDA